MPSSNDRPDGLANTNTNAHDNISTDARRDRALQIRVVLEAALRSDDARPPPPPNESNNPLDHASVSPAQRAELYTLACDICFERWDGLTPADAARIAVQYCCRDERANAVVSVGQEGIASEQQEQQERVCKEPSKLACGHIFGKECLREWLRTSSACPMCRRRVVPVWVEYQERRRAERGQEGGAELGITEEEDGNDDDDDDDDAEENDDDDDDDDDDNEVYEHFPLPNMEH
ncbi:hypothetical protein B0J12DRAFT_786795 [Macrophomina phaseolina]|uniref:RING-type domain-containing protein n=1 Tax=Macrophomina phaseolina TaxID=35725 RepID=A0ABQ8G800_9PEZI|nr:hypothetical protein B0J12DRAFT_786795 [Macrophomina phaseolina]